MSELSPKSQAIVDAGRDADEPSAADKERVRGQLAAKIVAAAAAGAGLSSTSNGASATTSGATKIIASVALALGVAGGSFAVYRWQSSVPIDKPVETAAVVGRPAAREATPVLIEQQGVSDPDEDPVVEELPVAEPNDRKPRERKVKKLKPHNASTLAEELLLIRTARTAMDHADARRALEILREHRVRFPKAILLEEAAAVRIDALCQIGRDDLAKRESKKFLRRWPRSPLAARVKTTCGYEENAQ